MIIQKIVKDNSTHIYLDSIRNKKEQKRMLKMIIENHNS